jgi:hypothetical protein
MLLIYYLKKDEIDNEMLTNILNQLVDNKEIIRCEDSSHIFTIAMLENFN